MRAIGMRLLGLVILAFSSSCAYAGPPIQLSGTPADVRPLVGEWWGEYVGDRDHARSGSIVFKLVAGEDHAHGDVLMTPEGFDRPYQRYQGDERGAQPHELAQMSRVLSIRLVRAVDGTLSGVLDPYWDPDRKTQASATFRGQVNDTTIEGLFTVRYADGSVGTGGRWKVTRRRP